MGMDACVVMILDGDRTKCVGTGFYIGDNKHIITCYHCVEDCTVNDKSVNFTDGENEGCGSLIKIDEDKDLALIETYDNQNCEAVKHIKKFYGNRDKSEVKIYGFDGIDPVEDYNLQSIDDAQFLNFNPKTKKLELCRANGVVAGYSGGPVFVNESIFIGMIYGYYYSEHNRKNDNAGAISVNTISEFIKDYDTDLYNELINCPDYKDRWFEPMFLNLTPRDENKTCEKLFICPDISWKQYEREQWNKYSLSGSKFKAFDNEFKSPNEIEKILFGLTENNINMLVLLGSPGSGKSTFSLWLYHKGLKLHRTDNVILWRFKDFRDIQWTENVNNIVEQLLDKIFPGNDQPEVKRQNLKTKTLILDGLDEISITSEKRVELINELHRYIVEKVKDSKVIVTCRTNGLEVDYNQGGHTNIKCPVAAIEPLSDTQFKEFAKKYGYDMNKLHLPEKTDERHGIREVIGIPLIFYMIMALDMKISGNTSRGEIYDRIFSFKGGIYERAGSYDQDTHNMLKNENNVKMLDRLSQDIAYWMFLNPKNEVVDCPPIPKEVAIELLEQIKQEIRESESNLDLTDTLMNSYYEINHTETDSDSIVFVHKSMMEYFVASRIAYELYLIYTTNPKDFEEKFRIRMSRLLSQRLLTDEIREYLEDILKRQYKGDEPNYPIKKMHEIEKPESAFLRALNRGLVYFKEQNDLFKPENNKFDNLKMEANAFENYVDIFQMINRVIELKEKYIFTYGDEGLKPKVEEYLRLNYNERTLDLSRLDLSFRNLSRLSLKNVKFCEAKLEKTSFDFSDLENADFTGADLSGAKFKSANLENADFTGAEFDENMSFRGALMTNVKGFNYDFYDNNKELFEGADFSGTSLAVRENTYPAVGSLYKFGNYWQNKKDNKYKMEPIWWRILDIKDGKALLLADKILDCQPYHEEYKKINWEECSLNRWLNGDFKDAAFNKEEKEKILVPEFSESPDNKIFLLSFEDVKKYLSRNIAERNDRYYDMKGTQATAKGTDYAKVKTNLLVAENGNSWWWLRGVSEGRGYAMFVLSDGYVNLRGFRVNPGGVGVRPALWLDLKSKIL